MTKGPQRPLPPSSLPGRPSAVGQLRTPASVLSGGMAPFAASM
jgi:hypothetical protein